MVVCVCVFVYSCLQLRVLVCVFLVFGYSWLCVFVCAFACVCLCVRLCVCLCGIVFLGGKTQSRGINVLCEQNSRLVSA